MTPPRPRAGGPRAGTEGSAPATPRAPPLRSPAPQARPLLIVGTAAGLVALLVTVGFTGAAIVLNDCSLSTLKPIGIGPNSFIYAADGSLLGSIPAEQNRTPVTRAEISPWLPKATVAIEDRRFYHHGGVDPQGIVRAVVNDISAGKAAEGGSTITQQLVRNLYLDPRQTADRKSARSASPTSSRAAGRRTRSSPST